MSKAIWQPAGLNLTARVVFAIGMAAASSSRGMYAAVGGALVILVMMTLPSRRKPMPLLVIALLGWMILSITWSMSPSMTMKEDVRLVLFAVGAMLVAQRTDLRAGLHLIGSGLTLLTTLSLAVGAAGVGSAWDEEGLLKGVMSHPNGVGLVAATGIVTSVMAGLTGPGCRRHRLWLFLNVVALALCGAMTSILAAGVALGIAMGFHVLRNADIRKKITGVLLTIGVLVIGVAWAVTNIARTTAALGRDITFTGRTYIWSDILLVIAQNPWLGYGIGGTWTDDSWIRQWINQRQGFIFITSHNGFLDAWLQLGLPGLIAFIALVLLSAYYWIPEGLRRGGSGVGISLVGMIICLNAGETSFLFYSGWFVLVYVYTAGLVVHHDWLRETRSTRSFAPRQSTLAPALRHRTETP